MESTQLPLQDRLGRDGHDPGRPIVNNRIVFGQAGENILLKLRVTFLRGVCCNDGLQTAFDHLTVFVCLPVAQLLEAQRNEQFGENEVDLLGEFIILCFRE